MNDKRNNQPPARTFHPEGARPGAHKRSKKRRTGAAAPGSFQRPIRPPKRVEVRRSRRCVLLTLYAVLCAEIGLALLTSPSLAIKTVRVRGLENLPPTERQQTLQALSVARGTNWFRTPLNRLRQNASALPWVRTASVERSYSNTLFVHVAPRSPFVALKAGGAWYEADADGVPIRIARPYVANRLPRVVLEQACVVQMGFPLGDPALAGALQIVKEIGQEQRLSLSKIVIDQSDNICLNMRDGIEFQLGQAADMAAKTTLVKRMYLRDPHISRTLAAVNLSCPTSPACTLRIAQADLPLIGPPMPPGSLTP